MKRYRRRWLMAVIGLAGLLIFLFLFGRRGDDNLAEPTTLEVISLATPALPPAPPTSTFTPPLTAVPPTPTDLLSMPTPTATTIRATATARLVPSPTTTAVPATVTAIPSPPTSTPSPSLVVVVQATVTPALPTATPTSARQLILLKPLPTAPCYGDQAIHFEWQWAGPFDPARQGFEVRLWREGEPPLGAHDAVLDNKNGQVKALDQNSYSLEMRIGGAAGVQGRSGDYLWTVLLVEIAPAYKELGIQAPPGRLCYAAPGGKSDDRDNGGSSGDGGGPINP